MQVVLDLFHARNEVFCRKLGFTDFLTPLIECLYELRPLAIEWS